MKGGKGMWLVDDDSKLILIPEPLEIGTITTIWEDLAHVWASLRFYA